MLNFSLLEIEAYPFKKIMHNLFAVSLVCSTGDVDGDKLGRIRLVISTTEFIPFM